MSYFYLCSYILSPYSIVNKGNWDRIINLEILNKNSYYRLLRELIFEKVRMENYRKRPSRLKSNFVCSNLKSAKEFKKLRPYDIIYEVEIVDTNANFFEAYWSLITEPYKKTINKEEDLAHKYWKGTITSDDKKEIIVDSNIRILKKLKDRS